MIASIAMIDGMTRGPGTVGRGERCGEPILAILAMLAIMAILAMSRSD
jgi:hypothetical protein